MNFTYLEDAFKKDNRATLLYPIKDYDNGMFLEIGTTLDVLDVMVDPHMKSGYSVIVKIKNAGRTYIIDKDFLMPYGDFKNLYNKALEMALRDAKL